MKLSTMTVRRALTRVTTVVTIAGLGLAITAIGASAALATGSASKPSPSASGPTRSANALSFDINGLWTDNGTAKPVFTVVNNTVLIDMTFAHRPNAVGSVISPTSILVTFPDADTFIGTLLSPTFLRWSNGSTWQKVFTGPTVIDLTGPWTDNLRLIPVNQSNGLIKVNMASSNRPNAFGFAVNSSTIRVTFPDSGAYTGTLQAPDTIVWSNGSRWHVEDSEPGNGNPDCLQARILC